MLHDAADDDQVVLHGFALELVDYRRVSLLRDVQCKHVVSVHLCQVVLEVDVPIIARPPYV